MTGRGGADRARGPLGTGAGVDGLAVDGSVVDGEVLLRLRGAGRSFGPVTALDGVDLDVRSGEVVTLLGLNGAGKTTMMRLLLGMLAPDRGEATVLGHPARTAPPTVWRSVGHLIETPFSYRELTVRENLLVAARLHGLGAGELGRAVDDALELLDLAGAAGRRAGKLSLGNRQRLGLAAAVVHGPRVLVLDEPTSGLDPLGIVAVRDLLRSRAAAGAAVLVSSHHLDEVARIADRVLVVHGGRIVGDVDPGGGDVERGFFELVLAEERAGRSVGGAEQVPQPGGRR